MKRLSILFLSMLTLTATALAQGSVDATFQFVDAQGNTVPDGTTITVTQLDAFGQMPIPLRVKNVSGQEAAASIYEVIADMPHGEWQTCAFGNCQKLASTGYSPKSVVDADYNKAIQTEWIPVSGQWAEWTATLQIHVFNITTKTQFGREIKEAGNDIVGYGPTVTIHFVYQDPAHVEGLESVGSSIRQCYTIDGRRISHPRKGLNVVRTADGRVHKFISH
ncbi:MAG: hypothetical protein IKO12_00225 [Bacteroidaceae bacterium]|nr:hypothetical protein [Bacteroidaceae bacterium]